MRPWRWKWSLIMIVAGLGLLFLGTREYVEPNLDEISRLKAKGLVTEIVAETVKETFSDVTDPSDYFRMKKDEQGRIQLIQANTMGMSQKLSALTVSLQEKYSRMKAAKIKIPVGTIFGSPILSQGEQYMQIRVLPLSVSACDFETSFESQGINQTKYQIFARIETEVRVLQPFSHENFKVITRMPLAELVIVGDVPENYVSVPKEDILDVT